MGATPFPGLLHFMLDTYLIKLSVKLGGIKYYFWVFGVTWPGIEPRSPAPLVNTLPNISKQLILKQIIYSYMISNIILYEQFSNSNIWHLLWTLTNITSSDPSGPWCNGTEGVHQIFSSRTSQPHVLVQYLGHHFIGKRGSYFSAGNTVNLYLAVLTGLFFES